MGMVYTEITLKNVMDEGKAHTGLIKAEDIRTATVTAVVDTGSMNLVITEALRQQLGLSVKEQKTARIANGQRVTCQMTEAVEVQWRNRNTILSAMVIPGAEAVLLGAIALEGMDLMVNPSTREVVGIHGDEVEFAAY